MKEWLNCIKICENGVLKDGLDKQIINEYDEFISRLGHKPTYNVWFDTKNPKCIGADETYENAVVANEASFLTSKENFLEHQRWGVSHAVNNYAGFINKPAHFVANDDIYYEKTKETEEVKGKTILILGAGPSTDLCDWQDIECDQVWSCNHFYNHPEIKKTKLSMIYLNNEVSMANENLKNYVEEFSPTCALDMSISLKHQYLRSFALNKSKTFIFGQRMFLSSGAMPKLISLATLLGAAKIYFCGMDGWTEEQIKSKNAGTHAFQNKKPLNISPNYTYDFQRRETVVFWDYLLNVIGKDVQYINLGEIYENNMSSDITKNIYAQKGENHEQD